MSIVIIVWLPSRHSVQSVQKWSVSTSLIFCVQEIEIQEEYEVGDVFKGDSVNGSDEELEIQPPIAPKGFFSYSVKIVNPLQMKDFHTVDLGEH